MKFLDYPELELLSRALTFETPECRVFTRLEAYSCKAINRERKLLKVLEENFRQRQALYAPPSLASTSGSGSGSAGDKARRNTGEILVDESGMSGADASRSSNSISGATDGGMSDSSADVSLTESSEAANWGAALDSPFGPLSDASSRKVLFLLITALNAAFPDHDFSLVNPDDFRREANASVVLDSLSSTLNNMKGSSGTPRSFSSLPTHATTMTARGGASSGSFGSGSGRMMTVDDHLQASRLSQSTSPVGGGAAAAAAIARFSTHHNALYRSSAGSNSVPGGTGSSGSVGHHPALSSVLDDIMSVNECDVFSFHPDLESDPHADGEMDEDEVGSFAYEDEERALDGLRAADGGLWDWQDDDTSLVSDRKSHAGPISAGGGAGRRRRNPNARRNGTAATKRGKRRQTTPRANVRLTTEDDTAAGGSEDEDPTDEENRAGRARKTSANYYDDEEDQHEHVQDDDEPVFDEDYHGGFRGRPTSGASGSRQSTATTRSSTSTYALDEDDDMPRTPVSIRRDYFGGNKQAVEDRWNPIAAAGEAIGPDAMDYDHAVEAERVKKGSSQRDTATVGDDEEAEDDEERSYDDDSHDDSDEFYYEENDELSDGGAADEASMGGGGVLWTSYAFFYNRRLKRILFVNIWARRTTARASLDGESASAIGKAAGSSSYPKSRRECPVPIGREA